jgi:putative transposase
MKQPGRRCGKLVVDRLRGKAPRLQVIAADHGYKISFIEHVEKEHGWRVEIAQKPESSRGFVPEKNRWPVERSFGWLNFRRRLFRDVEKTIESSEAMLRIAFISILINRVAT